MQKNQLIAIVVIVVVIVGAGAAFIYFSQPTRAPEDTLIWEAIGNPDYLDPHVDYESFGSWVSYNVYETLYTYDWGTDNTAPIVPLLAASDPVWADDGLSVNVTLRTGIKFHDGTPFNASCVKWNFERAMKIFYPDGPVWMFAEPIVGGVALEDIAFDEGPSSDEFAEAFDAWVSDTENPGMIVHSETLIEFKLSEAYVPFIPAITYGAGYMMSPTYAIKTGEHDNEVVDMHHYGVDYGEYEGYMAEHTCGTGPYQVTEWLKNQYVHMTYFEDYWRTDTTRTDITGKLALPSYAGSIKQAYIKTNEDVTTRVLNIRAGVSDGIYLPYTNAQDLLDLDTYDELYPDIHVSTGGTTFFVEHFGFNMKTVYDFNGRGVNLTSPFADINLRLCFAHAFNYTAYLTAAVQGFGVQAQGIIPQGLFGHVDDLPMYDTDLTKAAEYWELAMANPDTKAAFEAWEDNGGLPLGYNTGNTRREQACLILKDSIQKLYSQVTTKLTGVSQLTINIQGYEWSAYLDANRERNLACFIIGWIPDYADPDNYVFPYAYSRGTFAYRIGYNNSDVDEWYIQSRSEQSGTVRAQLFEQIEQAVYEDVPMIMVLQGGELRTWRTWVKGDGLLWNPMYTAGIEIGYMYYVYKDYGT